MTALPARAGCVRGLAASLAALVIAGCSHYSCYGVQFNTVPWPVRSTVVVTAADETAHPALKWVAHQVISGKTSGQVDGRGRFDDFRAYAREHNIDLAGVNVPVFVVRGAQVAIRGVNNCLM